MSKGGKPGTPDGTTIAASNVVTWVPGLIPANVEQQSSVGVSMGQRVGSLAASGVADGRYALYAHHLLCSKIQSYALIALQENVPYQAWSPVLGFQSCRRPVTPRAY